MYGVLLVDDEPIEREALKLLIKNNFQNLQVVGEAQNGFEAIELSYTLMPDIIVMDIRMPGISGLDAIREIKKTLPDAKFLILSSYNRFDYAQQALKLGVEDFIVKPVKMSIMIDALNSITDKIEDEQKRKVRDSSLESRVEGIKPIVENDAVRSIIYGCSDEKLKRFMDFLEICYDRAFCMIVKCREMNGNWIRIIKKSLADIGCVSICADVDGLFVFYILNPTEDNQEYIYDIGSYVKNVISLKGYRKLVIGLGKVYANSDGFRISYMEASEAVKFGENYGVEVVHYDSIRNNVVKSDVNTSEWIRKFSEAIWIGEFNAVKNLAESFVLQLLSVYGDNISLIKEKTYQVLLLIEKNFSDLFGEARIRREGVSFLEEISSVSDVKEINKFIVDKLIGIIFAINGGMGSVNVNSISVMAVEYIHKNFEKTLSLDSLAEKFNISPFYLSKIIKKQTGKNFTDLISELRIEKAKELLKNPDLSIKEVTYKSGFNSQNYFSRIFRKYVGVTPTEFRNLQIDKKREETK